MAMWTKQFKTYFARRLPNRTSCSLTSHTLEARRH